MKTMTGSSDNPQTMQRFSRHRLLYAIAILVVIVLGLASRRYGLYLPFWLKKNAGDALWALDVYLFFGFLRPKAAIPTLALAALAFAFFIETTQLYHAPWIDALRAYRLGALILGSGFLWSDFLCYTVGVAIGVLAEWLFLTSCRRR